MSKWLQNVYYFVLGSILLLCSTALAINGRTTYQAKIYKPDGLPLEAVSVNFRFTVLDPSSSCVLYVEDYAAVNMIGSGGLTSFSLGMGTRTYPASGPVTFASVFDNSTPSYVCQVPGVYNPIPTDNRKIVMQFNEGSGWQTLPAMAINSVPYSMYSAKAQNAQQLNGKADTSFVEYSALASLNCQTNEAIKFNGVSFSCIAVGVGSSGISSVTTSGTVLTTTGTASAPVISINVASMSSDGYLTSVDYAEFKAKLSASSTQIVNTLGYAPVSGAAVNSQIQASQLSGDVSGTVSANIVQSVGGKTAAQVSTSVNDTLGATSSATADTIVKRNVSGNITVNDIYANAAKVNYVDIYKPSTSFNIRLEAPTSLAANYTLALPTTSGSVGQVLSTDGSGNLSWINPSTGSVTSVSAVAPLSSTGGATPTISISQVTSSTNGYLSSADWNTFNNKQQATSAAIIATLGYTPANATSSTQWTTNGSHIYYSTGNVGIGVSNPVNALDVFGTVRAGAADNGSVSMGNDGNAFMELREYDNAGTPYIDFANDNSIDYDARFILSGDDTFELNGAMFGIGLRPTAVLSLAAGTATYGPLKFASGTLLTSPQSGTMEYDGSNFFLTDGANQRRVIATGSSQGSIDNASNINSSSNITMTPNNSVIVSSTAASTDANTGALIVKGGLGVAGTTNVSGNLNVSGSSVIDGSLRLSSMTSGSVLFAGSNGTVTQDNANFYWDGGGRRLGLGTTAPSALLHLSSSSQTLERIRLSGQEFYQAGNTDAEGLSLLLGVNRTGNRQLWIGDSAKLTQNASNTILRLSPSSGDISSLATDGVTAKNLLLNANGGNVGVGTTNPSYPLDVKNQMRIGAQGGSDVTLIAGGSGYGSQIYQYYADGVLKNVFSANGNSYITAGSFGVGTSVPTHVLHVKASSTYSTQTGQFAVGDSATDMKLNVGVGTDGANKVTWMQSTEVNVSNDRNLALQPFGGNVGIGTTTPQSKLHVEGATPQIYVKATDGNQSAVRFFSSNGAERAVVRTTASNELEFDTNTSTKMSIESNGNVGIGTTTPSEKLEVNGKIKLSNGFSATNAAITYNDYTDYLFLGAQSGSSDQGAAISIAGASNTQTAAASGGISFVVPGVSPAMVIRGTTGNVGIGTATPSYKLQVNGAVAMGDAVSGNSDASLTPLINHYLGGTGDSGSGSVAYILLAYNQTAANGITASGFDGQIYSYRGTAGTWNNATRMDIALKTAYDAPAVHRFSVDGPLANASVVTLTYSGTSYIGVQAPAASAMDYYITGRFWGFKPILLDSVNHGASISAVTEVSKPLISTVGGRVGIGTGNPQEKLHVEAPVAGRIQVGTGNIFTTSGYGVSLESDTDDGVSYINLHTQTAGANAAALVIRGGHGATETASTRSIASFRTDSGNVGIGYNAPTSKLHVNGGIKQPNYGQLVSIWDGATRTTTMPAFLTSTYMEDHQEETYTWRGIGPRLKDTAGCSTGPTGNYFFDGFDTTWNGVYRMTLGKLSGTTYLVEVEWRGWGTNLKDSAGVTVSTSSNQGTIQATLSWNGSVWTVEHMQGQVGTTPFSCH